MENSKTWTNMCPFPPGYRASGLLLHVTSLPSPYGIGDLGPSAYEWIDRLHAAGQTWWQTLPFGPTGLFDSPYSSLSSFMGNGMLVSPEFLIEDGLLTAGDCTCDFRPGIVDYDAAVPFKHRLLTIAWANFRAGARNDLTAAFEEFRHRRGEWLEDYALFRALKVRFNGAPYLDWPAALVQREPYALEQARRELSHTIDQVRLAQFLLSRQASRLKSYASEKGVRLIGDLPAFVSPDSSDIWSHPEFFLLDEGRRPRFVAGVPPDYFTAQGQLWGNPLYDWEALARTGYSWWIDRLRAVLVHADLVRLDHFRAFAAAWHVPAGAPTAETGEWIPGPGAALFRTVRDDLGSLPFLAEDLGFITPDVGALRDEFQIPATRVLQFGFDGHPDNPHLPHNCPANSVVYTGTHDNATTREWYETMPEQERRNLWSYLRRPAGQAQDVAPELIRQAFSCPAAVVITPLQDLLNLGGEARMNVPGRAEGNWRWRATPHMLSASNCQWLADLTKSSNRTSLVQTAALEASL